MASSKTSIPDVLKKKRCFLHIDLDCFFAQVEQVRLGLDASVPIVSQQWNAIIAVNYAARKYGISRLHHSVFEAKQLCPEVVCAHVATIGPGDSQPDYYPAPSRYTHKVSLDPYRKASAKIFSVFRKYCTSSQKGGLDEVFMDVTDIVNQRIMDEYGKDLSRWDRATAEMIDWQRDHPDAGVVFGLPKGDGPGGGALEVSLDDEDDYELGKEDGEGEDDQDPTVEMPRQTNPSEQTVIASTNGDDEPPAGEDDEYEFDDDLDLDALAAIEEIQESFTQDRFSASQSHTTLGAVVNQHLTSTTTEMSADQIQQQQEDMEAREKAEQEEKLRQEKEDLLPYYGIPEGTFEEQFWAEMQLLKAAEFCNEIRKAVKDELGYTCSAGVSNNRLLAKLGSGMNKPYQQTIILPRFIPDLMHGVKLSKIRGLGGKFGQRVMNDFQIERASQLWPVPLRRLQEKYSPQSGLDLWHWSRGIDHVGIRKVKSKSMCSHKSFIPALSDLEEIEYWIQTMCRELVSRMEAEYIETSRWPRTISLGFYGGIRADRERAESVQGGNNGSTAWAPPSKGSRQMPMGGRLDYGGVEGLTKKMFRMVERLIQDGRDGRIRPILPLIILTVTASNFDSGDKSAKDIASFFTKSSLQSSVVNPTANTTTTTTTIIAATGSEASGKNSDNETIHDPVYHTKGSLLAVQPDQSNNAKTNNKMSSSSAARKRFFGGIQFSPLSSSSSSTTTTNTTTSALLPAMQTSFSSFSSETRLDNPISEGSAPQSSSGMDFGEKAEGGILEASSTGMTVCCTQCPAPGRQILASEWDEHQDYHFALSLHNDERQLQRQQQQVQSHKRSPPEAGGQSGRGRRKKPKASSSSLGGGADSQGRPPASSSALPGAGDQAKLLTNFFVSGGGHAAIGKEANGRRRQE